MADGGWISSWLGGGEPATPTKRWEMSGLSTPRPSAGLRASPRASPFAPSISPRPHSRSAAQTSSGAGAAEDTRPDVSRLTPSRRRPPRPSVTSFSQNLVAVLNDPTRPRDPELFTRDWGDGFIPPPPRDTVTSRHHHQQERRDTTTGKLGGKSRISQRQPTTTDVVPEVFFRQDFDIGEREIFEEVLDPAHISTASAAAKHEQFGDYLDVVESDLSRSLSSKSDKFFAALTEQQILHHQVILALDDIRDLRGQLAHAQREAADDDLRFLKLLSSRDHAYALYQKLGMLLTVSQTPATIQLLLHTGDFVEALDLIATTQEIVKTELNGLHCLKHFASQLKGMEDVVHTMMRQEFVNSLLDELSAVPTSTAGPSAASLQDLAEQHTSSEVEGDGKCDRMRALLAGITRQQKFDFAPPYRKAVFGILQDVIKQQLARNIESEGGDGAGNRLKHVSFDIWIDFLKLLLRTLLLLLIQVHATHQRIAYVLTSLCGEDQTGRSAPTPSPPVPSGAAGDYPTTATGYRADVTGDLNSSGMSPDPLDELYQNGGSVGLDPTNALAILDGSAPHPEPAVRADPQPVRAELAGPGNRTECGWSVKEYKLVIRDSERVVVDVCEEMHSKISRMMLTRKKDKIDSGISIEMFVSEFNLVGEFIEATGHVSRKKCDTLRGTSHALARDFITTFHSKQKEKLTHLLANERWSKSLVPAEYQTIVDWLIQSGSVEATPAKDKAAVTDLDTPASGAPPVRDGGASPAAGTNPPKTLRVGDKEFRTVSAFLMYVQMIKGYVHCAKVISPLTQEIMNHLLESLRLFNKKTENLVLKMGALNLGLGMKSISAKNLALASQVLGAVMALIKHLQATFVALLPQNLTSFAADFDRVLADYAAHQGGISNQLVSIMEDQWDRCAEDMNWSKMSTTAGAKKVAASSKQMHKVLKTILSTAEVTLVFKSILVAYNKRLRTAAKNRGPNGKAIAVGIVADVVHFEEELGTLPEIPIELLREGLDVLGLVLPALVREIA